MPTPKTVDDIRAMLLRGEEVNLVGVGKLKVANKAGRNARNPQTGATVWVAPRKTVKFSESSVIKGELNPGA